MAVESVSFGEADYYCSVGAIDRELVKSKPAVLEKMPFEQQVLRRIATDGQFRKGQQIHTGFNRPGVNFSHPLCIPGQIAHHRIELSQPYAHRTYLQLTNSTYIKTHSD